MTQEILGTMTHQTFAQQLRQSRAQFRIITKTPREAHHCLVPSKMAPLCKDLYRVPQTSRTEPIPAQWTRGSYATCAQEQDKLDSTVPKLAPKHSLSQRVPLETTPPATCATAGAASQKQFWNTTRNTYLPTRQKTAQLHLLEQLRRSCQHLRSCPCHSGPCSCLCL